MNNIRHLSTIDIYEIVENEKSYTVRKMNEWQSGQESWAVNSVGDGKKIEDETYHLIVRKVQLHLLEN
jgi:hypothetical protein